jgi:hypothetical protein
MCTVGRMSGVGISCRGSLCRVAGMSGVRISRTVCAVVMRWFHGGHRIMTGVSSVIMRCLFWPNGSHRTSSCGVAVVAVVSCFHLVLHPVLRGSHRDWRRCHPMCQMFHARPLAVATVASLVNDPLRLFLA